MTKNTKDTKLETVGNSTFLKMKKAQIIIRNEQVIGSSPIGSSRGKTPRSLISMVSAFLFSYFHRTPCGTGKGFSAFCSKGLGETQIIRISFSRE